MQSWTLACKRYKKHGGRSDTDIVSYVAEGMFELCLVAWYQADQTRIDGLTLDMYLLELSQLVLEKLGSRHSRDHPLLVPGKLRFYRLEN